MSFNLLKISNSIKSFYLLRNRTFTEKYINKTRKQIKDMNVVTKKSKYAPGTVTLQVLGCGAPGAPAVVYLFTDQSRYLFNCGEGTQRLAHEHKTKLSRLEHIFFTGKCWSKLGGLPGLALTAQDAGVTKLTLHGPSELNTLFQAMNRFVVLKKIQIEAQSCSSNYAFEDEVMTVQAYPIICSTDSSNSTILYVCRLKPRPGSLDLKKCVDMGVPPGPLLGLLKNGMDVVLDNGTIVKSADVSEPNPENQVIVFVDIPSEDYLTSLITQFENNNEASVVIHFAPEVVINSSKYQKFTSSFGKLTTHIFLNTSNRFSGHFAAHRIQIQLNQLYQKIFPVLGEVEYFNNISKDSKRTKVPGLEYDIAANSEPSESENLEINSDIGSLTCFRLRPYKGLDRSMELKFTPNEYIKEIHALDGFTVALKALKSKLNKEESQNMEINCFPKIVFLGTGSCIPNKTRNVSAILLQLSEDDFILLDCGEGTLGQIIRFYGPSKWQSVIKNLKAIYVSHLHADHHIGLIGILKERSSLLGNESSPLYLFAPKQIHSWLSYYHDVIEPLNSSYILIPNGDMVNAPYQLTGLKKIDRITLSTCLVKHCAHSFGISITLTTLDAFSEPFKITYSGDTMPSEDLIELGSRSTILIHEATMEDELIDEAKVKMHCTISQALQVSQKMQAKNTILTHFSQRYAKLPRMPDGPLNNVAIAFDFMQVGEATHRKTTQMCERADAQLVITLRYMATGDSFRSLRFLFSVSQPTIACTIPESLDAFYKVLVGEFIKVTLDDLKLFSSMYPVMKNMFSDHYEEMERKTQMRLLKSERKRKSNS